MSGRTRIARRGARLAGALLLSLAAGCAQLVPQTIALRTGWPAGVARSVELQDVPFFPQDEYQCGPAALATVLVHNGVSITPQPLVREVYLPARHGSLQAEMAAAARRHGRVSYLLAPRYGDLLREVASGNPVVVLQDIGSLPLVRRWHYAVVNGFDYPSGTVWLRSGTRRRHAMPFTAFERSWMKSGYWAMVVTAPDRIPATASEHGWLAALLAFGRSEPGEPLTQAYGAALQRWPDSLAAAVGLANQHHARGELAQSVAVLRTARLRHPRSTVVANNLAQALSDLGQQPEALSLVEQVADPADPFAAQIRATRQLILQRMGRPTAGHR